jgi:copper chaperone
MTLNLMTPLPLAQPATAGCSCCTPRTTATPQPAPHEAGLSSTTADTATFAVAGMTCGHCIAAVTEELSTLPGVSAVNVDLVAGGTSTVTITSDTPVSRTQVAAALDAAGDYRLATS